MSRGSEKYLTRTKPFFDEAMGRRLCVARRKMNLTQAALGTLLGVSQRTISEIEAGRTVHSAFTTGRLKSVLSSHFDYVLTGDGASIYESQMHVNKDQFGNLYSSDRKRYEDDAED